MVTALAAIFVFLIIVLVHELGHFTVAKLVGVKVHEFAIGMGPRLFKFGKGETEYSLRALPIGGYVRMEGEDEESTDARSITNQPVLARIAVFAAGAIMNFLLAIVIFSLIAFNVGAITTTVDKLDESLPAYQSGMRAGDKIINIDGENIGSWEEIVTLINMSNGEEIKVTVDREGATKTFNIKPVVEETDAEGNNIIIGIYPRVSRSFGDIIKAGIQKTFFFVGLMFEFIGRLFHGNVGANDVAGPVGVISLVGEAAQYGFLNLLNIAGFLSINLGFINLLPIPALDGSRIMFGLIELVRRKPIDQEKEGFIHFIGFIFLLGLIVFITYIDVSRLDIF
ncbi:MAG: RIP metalloprotease RseP [Firmicutes bacterium]|nr:RIP metalloprotease RseP [Sporosalibacterium faouarense]MTI48029.1 RIP metalloprotease RseP [Bacillota bacterium]